MAELVGRYEVIRRLATGGMGEVFLARLSGAAGFEKQFVLKRVLPHLAENPEFRELFLDEARIAARLSHPNIAQIFELGDVAGQSYIVMEYVAGVDLKRLVATLRADEQRLPLGLACRIVADAAGALHYAHTSRDGHDRPMQLVHRDVSPHNLLVSFEGVVKLIDFGVARAANRVRTTEQSALRGKFPYMSPEQVVEGELDHRSDQFSLGVVFWELLTGQRLFRHDNDAVMLQLVADCVIRPPTELVPELPAALEAIVLRMLAKDPAQRFPDCGAVRLALEDFVLEAGLPATSARLALLMRERFPDAVPPPASPSKSRSSSRDETVIALLKGVVGERPLPAPTSSFVGRTAELLALQAQVTSGVTLLTLVGPGGAGKTRLATELARALAWPAAFADLTEATDHESLCAAVAAGLGVVLAPGIAPEVSIGRALADRGQCVVVLDNFEQLLAVGTQSVALWRTRAPSAVLVVTSREALKLPGEQVFEVPPLAEAEALFLERAKQSRPSFELSEGDRGAISAIVASLDGLPLAIELAAARLAVLSPAQLVQRLPRRLDLLASRLPDVAARQATMRGAIDWSWELLQPHEQATLAQLGVFRGGFTLEAAEAVVELSDFPGAPWALDVVQTLHEKSLVRRDEVEGGLRFGLLESIRAFALEKLAGHGAEARAGAQQRHATLFLELGPQQAAQVEQGGVQATQALAWLSTERDNLLAVWQRAVDARDGTQAMQAALALDPLLSLRGPFATHLAMLETSSQFEQAEPSLRARGGLALGLARLAHGRLVEAFDTFERALPLAVTAPLQGRLHHGAASALRQQGRMDEAKARYEQALTLARRAPDRWLEGRVLGHLGGLAQEMGALEASRPLYERALAIHREVNDRRSEGIVLGNLGSYHHERRNDEQARTCFVTALALHREVGNRRSEGIVLSNLSSVARAHDSFDEATALLEQAQAIHREVGNTRFEAIGLYHLGVLALERADVLEAEHHFGQALALFTVVNDRRYLGVGLAHRGAALAWLGRADEGQELLAQGVASLHEVPDAPFHAVVSLCRAHFLAAGGDHQAAREVIARLSGEATSLVEHSEHVRSAVRALEAMLAAR